MDRNINLFDHIETRVDRISFATLPDGEAALVLFRPQRDGKSIVFPVQEQIVKRLRELADEAEEHFSALK